MTEAEWLACGDPVRMVDSLRASGSVRKLRLFAGACCRRLAHVFPDALCGEALRVIESWIEGAVPDEARERVHLAMRRELSKGRSEDWEQSRIRELFHLVRLMLYDTTDPNAYQAARGVALCARKAHEYCGSDGEVPTQCALLRDIFGNPFRPVTLDPAWLTSDVLALARGVYEEHVFDRLPILADALQDAGCDNDDVLTHCRDPQQVHVRGCWVVDLVLGKS